MKKQAITAIVCVAAMLGASAATVVAQSQRFPDVPVDHYAFEAVEWAAEVGVTTGYADGTFKPQRPLSKRHAVVFMERYYDEILQAEESEDFTRGDMMVLLKTINDGTIGGTESDTAAESPPEQGASQRFPDVPPDHYAFEAAEWAAEVGVTTGYGDGTFKPQRPLSKRHAVVFMERFYDEILGAEESEDFTRGDMMVLLKTINDGTIGGTKSAGTVPIPSGSVATDRAALVAMYHATDGPSWDVSDRWLTDLPLGSWHGVATDGSGRVQALDFGDRWGPRGEPLGSGNNLSGAIPPEIGDLTSLSYLSLKGNNLSGAIPSEIGNLTSLWYLSLEGNNLSGAIPSEIGNLISLRELYLDFNALTGAIPSEIGNLVVLVGLGLFNNNLDAGPIPVEFARLANLERLRIDIGQCAPSGLRSFLRERRLDILPCTAPEVRLLPGARLREDSEGLALALDEDLQNPVSVTVSDPAVVTAAVQNGWLVLAPEGRGEADVVIVPSDGGLPATATVVVRAPVGTFGIDIVMEQPVTDVYAETITAAADQWSSVLDGTQWEGRDARQYCARWKRDVPVAASGNELVIWAERESDPSFLAGATGWACQRGEGPNTEPSHYYPVAGIVTANARVPSMLGDVGVMRHEIGHVLGLTNGFPPATGLVTEDWKFFVGSRAVAAFREGGGDPGLRGIPLDGTHWGYGVGGPEVMSAPWGADGLSVAALADAGYTVDMSKATPWYQQE